MFPIASLSSVLNSLPEWALPVLLVLLIIACVLIVKQIFDQLVYLRFLQDTPPSKIRSASQGYVELVGRVANIPAVNCVAPLTEQPCCWYYYCVEEWLLQREGNRRYRYNWQVQRQGISEQPFWLIDGDDKVVIAPKGAEVNTVHQRQWISSHLPEHMQPQAPFWVRLLSGQLLSRRRFRFTEKRIEVGDALHALGFFETRMEADGIAINRLSVNHLGKTPFILSNLSQQQLLSRYRWRVTFNVFGLAALIIVSHWVLEQWL